MIIIIILIIGFIIYLYVYKKKIIHYKPLNYKYRIRITKFS